MGESDITSIAFAFVIFALFLIGGGLLISESLDSYNLDDDSILSSDQVNMDSLEGNLTSLIGDAEDQQQDSTPSDSDAQERSLGAITKVINKLGAIKSIKLTIQNIISVTLDFVPSFILWGVFGILSLLLVMLFVRVWIQIRP